jgi:hypothetical protein
MLLLRRLLLLLGQVLYVRHPSAVLAQTPSTRGGPSAGRMVQVEEDKVGVGACEARGSKMRSTGLHARGWMRSTGLQDAARGHAGPPA